MVGWVKVFSWLFAGRTITQMEAAVGGQVWAATPLDGCCIGWQWVIPAVRVPW
jgi:hypothetical protein